MKWYYSNPSNDQQEKFLPDFEDLLSQLERGCAELNPNRYEIMHGFGLGGEVY